MKKGVFIFLFGLMLIFGLQAATGDVNGDGTVNIIDALVTAQYSVGLNPSPFIQTAADVDCSGIINIVDALQIAQYYVGLISGFPQCYTPAPTPTRTAVPTATPAVNDVPVGWAAVNYLGQNGTTGGAGGQVIDVYNFQTLTSNLSGSTPKILILHGTISGGTPRQLNVESNKTIIGADSGAYLDFGFYIRGNNIIIRNLDIWNGGAGDTEGYDGVSWAANLHHVWIDHCTFHECTDGAVDPTRNCRFVTISYCRFHTQNKTMLIGASDDDPAAAAAQSNSDKREWHYTVTVHHNWFRHNVAELGCIGYEAGRSR